MRIAVLGARGFVGSAVVRAAERAGHDVIPLVRESALLREHVDWVVNAACPSSRLAAERDPYHDYRETVLKTARFFYNMDWDSFCQVSSLSAETEITANIYGRHRAMAEDIMLYPWPSQLVVRLGPMYGTGLRKGVLFDLIHDNPVFGDPKLRYAFSDVDWVGDRIIAQLAFGEMGVQYAVQPGAWEIGAIANAIGSKSKFGRSAIMQGRQWVSDDPEATPTDVIEWAKAQREAR